MSGEGAIAGSQPLETCNLSCNDREQVTWVTLTSYFVQTSHKTCKTIHCEERLKCVLQATTTPHLNPTCCVVSRFVVYAVLQSYSSTGVKTIFSLTAHKISGQSQKAIQTTRKFNEGFFCTWDCETTPWMIQSQTPLQPTLSVLEMKGAVRNAICQLSMVKL
ncbi:hypothetical protein EPI10_004550 [Gossypium australe]|uniref:Uncharacterized protein n=1 Tax=Gossypium australe TaxID=47621 RepID=A0A5B6WLL0_9ROSI|nr:hypothetical protein EPI10_004550 [Gossypium australe]